MQSPRASLTSLPEKASQGTSEIFKAVFGEIPQNVNGDERYSIFSLTVAWYSEKIVVLANKSQQSRGTHKDA